MKRIIASLLLLSSLARADVVSTTSVDRVATFTNAQANFAWAPTAVVVVFPAATTGTLTVARQGNGSTVPLSATSFTNVQHVVWAPEAAYVFPRHSALTVSATAAGEFTVQLHRKAAP